MTWDEFYSSLKKKVGIAADKINQTADLATLQVKLSLQEHKLEEAYAALGKVAYEHFLNEGDKIEAITAAMEAVDAEMKKVAALKAQIEALKNEDSKAKEDTAENKETAGQEQAAPTQDTEPTA
ncbi:MAG: hypothetical protein IJF33_04110 [Clostridia bacterium]|nr:hypothetical protein [Clostridia bacterium]